MLRYILTLCLLVTAYPAQAQDADIKGAYEAIPHRQTTFDVKSAQSAQAEAQYLSTLFAITDRAMWARVKTLQHFYYDRGGMDFKTYEMNIDALIHGLETTAPPSTLTGVRDKILSAIKDQKAFFEYWHSLEGMPEYAQMKNKYVQHAKVLSAHRTLISAYNDLMKLYPKETAHNRQAFFDHLCALDFL